MTVIDTYSGWKLDFNDIDSYHPSITDIAVGLSNTCRYAGQREEFYSVAEHSVLVALMVARDGGSRQDQMQALLHDATEAFMGDINAPLKSLLPDFKAIENKLSAKIYTSYGLSADEAPIVKKWDLLVRDIENPHLQRKCKNIIIQCLPPKEAKKLFLKHWEILNINIP